MTIKINISSFFNLKGAHREQSKVFEFVLYFNADGFYK